MKVLQVFGLFSLTRGGGTVAVVYNLSRALVKRGHNVAIYTSDYQLDQEYINSLQGVKVYPFHSYLNLTAGFHLTPDMVREAKKKLKDFDVIHMHSYRSFHNVVIYYFAKKYGVPYIVDAHGSTLRGAGGKRDLKWLLRWLFDFVFGYRILRDASRVVAQNEVAVSEYREAGVDQDKILLLSLPFDVETFSRLPQPRQFRHKFNIKEKHIILFLGRIHWMKGLDFLVRSFYELAQYRSDVILVIVGPDDGYKPTLVKLIDKLNLSDKVLFTGFLDGEEKLSALIDATVLVQPSIYEQASWVPFEAILCNTPIIVSKNTGAGEDVSKIDAGYLVEYGNKNELINTIQKIFNNSTEAASKTQKAKNYIITNLSLEKQAEQYEKLYLDCIETKKAYCGV